MLPLHARRIRRKRRRFLVSVELVGCVFANYTVDGVLYYIVCAS